MKKYKISLSDLESRHSINKLERDGFTRHDIIKSLYEKTDGASQEIRTKMATMIYDRSEK